MNTDKYILVGRKPIKASLKVWAKWMQTANRSVALTEGLVGGKRVSTVFLGIDHGYSGGLEGGPPLVFETMVFEKDEWADIECERTSTWEEAEKVHEAMVAKYQPGIGIARKAKDG